jgi:hypothetical protein
MASDNPFDLPDTIHVAIHAEGGFAWHNLACWLCNERPAVYSMHPNWCFLPCRECQRRIDSPVWTPERRRLKRLFNALGDDPLAAFGLLWALLFVMLLIAGIAR